MTKTTKILTAIVALVVLACISYLFYGNWKTNIMKVPPKAPSNLVADPSSAIELRLTWKDNSNNENGFLLYRDGKEIAQLPENNHNYVDKGLRPATSYHYEIKAFNKAGESDLVASSGKTRNPPIKVWIEKIGVHENGEEGELLREYDILGRPQPGEVSVGLVVGDGKNSTSTPFPNKGYYELMKDQVIQVDTLAFDTQQVGNNLTFFATAYEDDGGSAEQLAYKALGTATSAYIGNPGSILLKLAGVDLSKVYADLFGAEDDWLGSFGSEWTSSNNWGVGNYADVQCKRPNGHVGLRIWFKVECPVYDYASGKAIVQ